MPGVCCGRPMNPLCRAQAWVALRDQRPAVFGLLAAPLTVFLLWESGLLRDNKTEPTIALAPAPAAQELNYTAMAASGGVQKSRVGLCIGHDASWWTDAEHAMRGAPVKIPSCIHCLSFSSARLVIALVVAQLNSRAFGVPHCCARRWIQTAGIASTFKLWSACNAWYKQASCKAKVPLTRSAAGRRAQMAGTASTRSCTGAS